MLMQEPTPEMIEGWKKVWDEHKDFLKPNRKSGQELLDYLSQKYILTEIHDKKASDAVHYNVTMNQCWAEKLPRGTVPIPKTYFLENEGNGEIFYRNENKDPIEFLGGDITRIFVGIDLASGYYMVEGSSMLWDELCAFQGLDQVDIRNCFSVAQYIASLRRFGML